MSEPWSPFCPSKANYNHKDNCNAYAACPWCGQANPAPPGPKTPEREVEVVYVAEDTPPARESYKPLARSRFEDISHESVAARQAAIIKTNKKSMVERPHAGGLVHSRRSKPSVGVAQPLSKKRITEPKQWFAFNVTIYVGKLIDVKLDVYENWSFLCAFNTKLSSDISIGSMDDFVDVLVSKFDKWPSIMKVKNPREIFVVHSLDKKHGPLYLPRFDWSLPIKKSTEDEEALPKDKSQKVKVTMPKSEKTKAIQDKIKHEPEPEANSNIKTEPPAEPSNISALAGRKRTISEALKGAIGEELWNLIDNDTLFDVDKMEHGENEEEMDEDIVESVEENTEEEAEDDVKDSIETTEDGPAAGTRFRAFRK